MKFWHFCPHMGKKTVFSAPTQTKFEYLLFFKVHQIKIAQMCLLPCLTRPANTHKCTRKSGNFLESQAILLQNPHKSTLLLFLVVWALLFFLSYHSFFLQHGCLFLPFFLFLVGFGLGCFSVWLFPSFVPLGLFFFVSLSGVFGGPTLSKLDIFLVGVIEVIIAKRGFFLRKEREKKTSQTTGRRGLLN